MTATPSSTPAEGPTPRVAVVYHFLPNYRQGVFDALAAADGWDVTFITGHSRPGQEGVPEATGLDPVVGLADHRQFENDG